MTLEPSALHEAIHEALRAWNTPGGASPATLDHLLLVKERRAQLAGEGHAIGADSALYTLLLEAIEELQRQDETAAGILRARFVDNRTLLMTAHRFNISEHTVSRLQRAAIERLASIVHEREMALRRQRLQQSAAMLPPSSYTQLFGVQALRETLVAHLQQEDGPAVTALVGIGGIGKTALADAATRALLQTAGFDHALWLRYESRTMSGKPLTPTHAFETLLDEMGERLAPGSNAISGAEKLAAIRARLNAARHLVVVDNLEDEAVSGALLHHLLDLAGPARFLLTTRSRLTGQAAVRHISLPELSLEDAVRLVRHHAADVGITAAAQATKEVVSRIYDVTGGNPLALKLVVGLLDSLPLDEALEQLARRPAGPVEALYRHIYWQTWRVLDEPARALLQAMPLVASGGGEPQYLMAISGLDEAGFWPAVQQLRARSLLEVRGTLEEKRYGVHRLTETFVRTEIVRWPEE